MQAVVNLARTNGLSDRDIADLAQTLATSGAHLEANPLAADLASTGGPSSLSTLICPLQLCARGLTVPKLGVRGRPAGGIDILETIPGFQPKLDRRVAGSALAQSRYIHLLADEHWAPLDARLFGYRQLVGAQDVPDLVIASILAKKLAVGVRGAGLEIRVAPHGNFGTTLDAARHNAHRYNAVAAELDLRPVCILTDGTRPYQPYVGRGEALVALASVLDGKSSDWLADHVSLCLQMSDAVAEMLEVDTARPVGLPDLRTVHEEMLLAQGASPAAFWMRVEEIQAALTTTISAEKSGWIEYDLGVLRTLLVDQQRSQPHHPNNQPLDPAGVTLLAKPGDFVETGDPVMTVRVADDPRFVQLVQGCLCISQTEGRTSNTSVEVVTSDTSV